VAAPTDPRKKIRVVSAVLNLAATGGTVTLQSSATTANNAGVWNMPADTAQLPLVLPYNSDGWFDTSAGEALNAVVTGSTLTGSINYVVV